MEEDGGNGGGKKRIRNTLRLARSLTAKGEELNERSQRVGRGDRNRGETKQIRVSTNLKAHQR